MSGGGEHWWDGEISQSLEDAIAAGGTVPRELNEPIGELLRRTATIESVLAAATMAYFRPAQDERAAELEALLSFHLSFDVLIDLFPRLVASLPSARQEWVQRNCANPKKELHALREFRNAVVHGSLWWDFRDPRPDGTPALKVYSYSRTMSLKSIEVTAELIGEWVGRAHEACVLVGQVHYWLSAAEGG